MQKGQRLHGHDTASRAALRLSRRCCPTWHTVRRPAACQKLTKLAGLLRRRGGDRHPVSDGRAGACHHHRAGRGRRLHRHRGGPCHGEDVSGPRFPVKLEKTAPFLGEGTVFSDSRYRRHPAPYNNLKRKGRKNMIKFAKPCQKPGDKAYADRADQLSSHSRRPHRHPRTPYLKYVRIPADCRDTTAADILNAVRLQPKILMYNWYKKFTVLDGTRCSSAVLLSYAMEQLESLDASFSSSVNNRL